MNIIAQSGELTRKESYNLMEDPNQSKMSDHVGEVLEMKAWILYENTNKDGQDQKVLSIMEESGLVSSTISPTFIKSFENILDFMKGSDEEWTIQVLGGTSKNGREYITCKLV